MTIWRNEQPAPTEPGWYYARPTLRPTSRRMPGKIRPVLVRRWIDTNLVASDGCSLENLHHYAWFGPIEQVREG